MRWSMWRERALHWPPLTGWRAWSTPGERPRRPSPWASIPPVRICTGWRSQPSFFSPAAIRAEGEQMARAGLVGRPLKRTEYQVVFATREAEKGWRDLCATTVNAMADAWDYLTKTPDASPLPHGQLKGRLATLMRDGRRHVRWQCELPGGARIWYWIEPPTGKGRGRVLLERVTPHHPNETK